MRGLAVRVKRNLMIVFILMASSLFASCTDDAPEKMVSEYDRYKGQWLVVNYWAEWCKPCIREIPELSELNHSRSDVTVFALNFDGVEGDELLALHKEMGIDYPNAPEDPKHQFDYPTPAALPTTVIINPDGELHKILLGEQSREKLLAVMEIE